MTRAIEPSFWGHSLGYWIETAFDMFISAPIPVCLTYVLSYFVEPSHRLFKVFGLERKYGTPCPPGFALTMDTLGDETTLLPPACISDVAWTLEKGPTLTYLLLAVCLAGLGLSLVRRARDAGVTFTWPGRDRKASDSNESNRGQSRFVDHTLSFHQPYQMYLCSILAGVQIATLLKNLATATYGVDTVPDIVKGHWVRCIRGDEVLGILMDYDVAIRTVLQVALAGIVVPLGWLTGKLIAIDNHKMMHPRANDVHEA